MSKQLQEILLRKVEDILDLLQKFQEKIIDFKNDDSFTPSKDSMRKIESLFVKEIKDENVENIKSLLLLLQSINSINEEAIVDFVHSTTIPQQLLSLFRKISKKKGNLTTPSLLEEAIFTIRDLCNNRTRNLIGTVFLKDLFNWLISTESSCYVKAWGAQSLCEMLVKCPDNLKLFYETFRNVTPKLKSLFEVAQKSSEYFLQANIIELLWRLTRKEPTRLSAIGLPTKVNQAISSISGKSAVLDIQNVVIALNESLSNKIIYSYRVSDVIVNGKFVSKEVFLHIDGRLVSFGTGENKEWCDIPFSSLNTVDVSDPSPLKLSMEIDSSAEVPFTETENTNWKLTYQFENTEKRKQFLSILQTRCTRRKVKASTVQQTIKLFAKKPQTIPHTSDDIQSNSSESTTNSSSVTAISSKRVKDSSPKHIDESNAPTLSSNTKESSILINNQKISPSKPNSKSHVTTKSPNSVFSSPVDSVNSNLSFGNINERVSSKFVDGSAISKPMTVSIVPRKLSFGSPTDINPPSFLATGNSKGFMQLLETAGEEQIEINQKEKKEWEQRNKRKLESLEKRMNSQAKRLKLSVEKFIEEITAYGAELDQVLSDLEETQSSSSKSAMDLALEHEKRLLRSIRDAAKIYVK